MKAIVPFLFLLLVLAIGTSGTEPNPLADGIRAALPKRGWTIEDRGSSLVITGPEVRTLWRVSLPFEPDQKKLWRDYATSRRAEVVIEFQGLISDEDLAELQNLKERFGKIMAHVNRGIDHLGKDGDTHVRKFGFVRLPDYRSSSASLFVSDNVAACGNSPLAVDPEAVREVVRKVYGVIEAYCKSDMDAAKGKARRSVVEPEE